MPALVGSTSDDLLTNIPLRHALTVADYKNAAGTLYGPDAARFLQLYPATTDEEARTQGSQVGMNSGLGAWAYSWARHQAEDGKAPVWLFRFSRVPPYHPGVAYSDFDARTGGAYHSADVPYWLGTYNTYNLFRVTRDWTPLDVKLSNQMMDAIVAFARTGTP